MPKAAFLSVASENFAETLGAASVFPAGCRRYYHPCCHSVVVPVGFRLAGFAAPCLDTGGNSDAWMKRPTQNTSDMYIAALWRNY